MGDIAWHDARQTRSGNLLHSVNGQFEAPDQQVRAAFIQLGMSSNMADLLLEMSGSLNSGYMRALEPRSAQNTTPTSYETFVTEEFLPLYEGKSATA
jgi:hypothetical protein